SSDVHPRDRPARARGGRADGAAAQCARPPADGRLRLRDGICHQRCALPAADPDAGRDRRRHRDRRRADDRERRIVHHRPPPAWGFALGPARVAPDTTVHGTIESQFRVEWRALAELAGVADEWRALAARAIAPNVFYEPSFALAAQPVFGREAGAGLVW